MGREHPVQWIGLGGPPVRTLLADANTAMLASRFVRPVESRSRSLWREGSGSSLAPLQGFGARLIQPAQARWICPLSSSYVFYKYIVVVVERAPACGQPRFSQARRALAWPPSLCTTPCSRCCGNGDKSQPMRWSVDNSAVVPELSPALRTSRPVHQISSKSAAGALQTIASSYEFDSPHGSRHLGGTVLSRRCPSGPTFSRPHCPGEGD